MPQLLIMGFKPKFMRCCRLIPIDTEIETPRYFSLIGVRLLTMGFKPKFVRVAEVGEEHVRFSVVYGVGSVLSHQNN